MPKELGRPKYFKYTECEEGDVLVTKGEYIGTTEGKFGDQYNFMQIDDNQHVVLNKAGVISYRIEQGHMKEGDVFDIVFDGKDTLESGQYKGKEVNNFKILKYGADELPAGFQKSVAANAPVAIKEETIESSSLDDLE